MYNNAVVEWLNYHHLLYFWVVAREGSIARACDKLLLSQPTISGQLRLLEQALGEKLFMRRGRQLVLTEVGRLVARYAEEIFSLGQEMTNALQGRETGRSIRFVAGVADVVPKLVAWQLLSAAMGLPTPVQITCVEGKLDHLLAGLSVHELDVVLADAPIPPTLKIKAHSHLLRESEVSFFATSRVAASYRRRFPQSLDGAPLLLPTRTAALRRALEDWFASIDIHPVVMGEFDDSAMLKAFGQSGGGIFPGSSVMEMEIRRQYRVQLVGHVPAVKDRLYAITAERRFTHPAVEAMFTATERKVLG